MKTTLMLALAAWFSGGHLSYGQGTTFTYQGRVTDNGNAANGDYDLRFSLYEDPGGGNGIGSPLTNRAVRVSNGLFTTSLDFGLGVFDGRALWLQVAVRTNGGTAFSTLAPRQPLTPAPYSLRAANAGTVAGSGIQGTVPDGTLSPNIARLTGANQVFTGASTFSHPSNWFAGNGSRLTNLRASEVLNIKAFGAVGNNPAADSLAISNAVMAWTNSGGVLYVPSGTYYDTNRYVLNACGGSALAGRFPLTIAGPGILKHTTTRAGAYFTFQGISPNMHDVTFEGPGQWVANVDGLLVISNAQPVFWSNMRFNNWGGRGIYEEGIAGGQLVGGTFRNCGIGLAMATYSDGWEVNTRIDVCDIGIHLTRTNVAYRDISGGNPAYRSRPPLASRFFICGANNDVAVRIDEGGKCNHFSGYLETCVSSFFDIGNDPGGSPNYSTDGTTIENMMVLGTRADCPSIRIYSKVNPLTLRNFRDGGTNLIVKFMTNAEAGSSLLVENASTAAPSAFAQFSDGSIVPAGTRSWRLNWTTPSDFRSSGSAVIPTYYDLTTANFRAYGRADVRGYIYGDGTYISNVTASASGSGSNLDRLIVTNRTWLHGELDVGGLAFLTNKLELLNGYLVVNSGLTNGIVNIADYVNGTKPWMIAMGDSVVDQATKNARMGVRNYLNSGPLGTMLYGNWQDATHYNLYVGGGYSLGAAPSSIQFRVSATPQLASLGTLALAVGGDGGVRVGAGAGNVGSQNLYVDGNVATAGRFAGNGAGLTNVALASGSSLTNITLQGDTTLQGNLKFGTGALRQMLDLRAGQHGIGVQSLTTYFRTLGGGTVGGGTNGGFAWYQGGVHADAQFDAGGGQELMRLNNGGLTVRGTFVSSSDRDLKAGFEPVDPKAVLEKVAALPITRWHYTNDIATPHLGPVAQDFHATFGLGPDDKHIATVDAEGVALAAIQGLNQKLEAELKRRDAENADLRKQAAAVDELIRRLAALERRVNARPDK